MKKSISYSGAKCWNDLPTDLRSNTLTMNQFRAILEGAELVLNFPNTVSHCPKLTL